MRRNVCAVAGVERPVPRWSTSSTRYSLSARPSQPSFALPGLRAGKPGPSCRKSSAGREPRAAACVASTTSRKKIWMRRPSPLPPCTRGTSRKRPKQTAPPSMDSCSQSPANCRESRRCASASSMPASFSPPMGSQEASAFKSPREARWRSHLGPWSPPMDSRQTMQQKPPSSGRLCTRKLQRGLAQARFFRESSAAATPPLGAPLPLPFMALPADP
mmetsp:Transcript_11398/g.36229  ORF Transcript_11398/g.36229 Transcript_11398/m.36229 type:complete len:217 (-) Transcript_11398:46-696(-)